MGSDGQLRFCRAQNCQEVSMSPRAGSRLGIGMRIKAWNRDVFGKLKVSRSSLSKELDF